MRVAVSSRGEFEQDNRKLACPSVLAALADSLSLLLRRRKCCKLGENGENLRSMSCTVYPQ
jgi:hypothetical protein